MLVLRRVYNLKIYLRCLFSFLYIGITLAIFQLVWENTSWTKEQLKTMVSGSDISVATLFTTKFPMSLWPGLLFGWKYTNYLYNFFCNYRFCIHTFRYWFTHIHNNFSLCDDSKSHNWVHDLLSECKMVHLQRTPN